MASAEAGQSANNESSCSKKQRKFVKKTFRKAEGGLFLVAEIWHPQGFNASAEAEAYFEEMKGVEMKH